MNASEVNGGRTAIVISGMHRSGTSALARVLGLLGATLPATLIPGRKFKGDADYWEGRLVVDLDQRIQQVSGTWWGGWQLIADEAIPDRPEFLATARRIVRDEFGGSDLILLKDPRMSRLMPFWTEALEAEGYRVAHVLAYRHPGRVADSLKRRDWMIPPASGLSWLAHTLDAELASRTGPRVVVSLDGLVEDWRAEIDRIAERLGIRWPVAPDDVADEIATFIDPALSHLTNQPVGLIDPVVEVIERWAADDVRPGDAELLDHWRELLLPIRRLQSPTARLAENRRQRFADLTDDDLSKGWLRADRRGFNIEARAAWGWLQTMVRHERELERLRQQHRAEIDSLRIRRRLVGLVRRIGVRAPGA